MVCPESLPQGCDRHTDAWWCHHIIPERGCKGAVLVDGTGSSFALSVLMSLLSGKRDHLLFTSSFVASAGIGTMLGAIHRGSSAAKTALLSSGWS